MQQLWRLLRADRMAAILGGAAAALLLLNTATVLALSLPLRQRIRAREEGLYALQGELRGLRQAAGAVETAGRVEREVRRLRESFPPRREVVALVRELSGRATAARLTVGGIDYKPTEIAEEGLLKLDIALGVEGSYADLRRFLVALEGMRGRLAISHLAATGRSGEGQVSARLALTAYFRTDQARPVSLQPVAATREEEGS